MLATKCPSPILVDDADPNSNWSKTASENEWCTGNGTLENPYLIENLVIDGNGTAKYCVEIRNSRAYFVVKNCVTYNARLAGIRLENTTNGLVKNSKSSKNDCGISLTSS